MLKISTALPRPPPTVLQPVRLARAAPRRRRCRRLCPLVYIHV